MNLVLYKNDLGKLYKLLYILHISEVTYVHWEQKSIFLQES